MPRECNGDARATCPWASVLSPTAATTVLPEGGNPLDKRPNLDTPRGAGPSWPRPRREGGGRRMRRLIKIYDTTLRDGTQGEGISFSMEDKVRLASRLDALGIHYIEGGWPGSNPKDLRFFARMQEIGRAHV